MELVQSGLPFSFSYPDILLESDLYVQAQIYDVTTGTPVFVTSVDMSYDAAGVYSGTYVALANKSYLVITAVFTDHTYDTIDPDYAPWADCYQNPSSSGAVVFLPFNYATYDQNTGLYIAANVFDVTSGSPVFSAQVPMSHVEFGVYFGYFTGTAAHAYQAAKAVYTSDSYSTLDTTRAPGSDNFQCATFGSGTSIDPGIENVRQGVAYEIDGVDLVGTLLSTDPGNNNVLYGITYVINSVDLVGTYVPEVTPNRPTGGFVDDPGPTGRVCDTERVLVRNG